LGLRRLCLRDRRHDLSVPLPTVESRLLGPIKRDLFSDEMVAEVQRRYAKAMASRRERPSNAGRIEQLKGEVANLVDAIAAGMLRSSPVLAQRLTAAETELARLEAQDAKPTADVVQIPILLQERYRHLVQGLETALARGEVNRARTLLRQLIGGEIIVQPSPARDYLPARVPAGTETLLSAAADSEIMVVPGTGGLIYCQAGIRQSGTGYLWGRESTQPSHPAEPQVAPSPISFPARAQRWLQQSSAGPRPITDIRERGIRSRPELSRPGVYCLSE